MLARRDVSDSASTAPSRAVGLLPGGGLLIRDLTAGYGPIRILRGVSVAVPHGEVVALLGPNGAGKSTLQRSICGLTTVISGSMSYNGVNIVRLQPHRIARLGVCYIPEGRAVYRGLTVRENLRMFACRDNSSDRVSLAFEMFPVLRQREKQLAGTLSGGEQQMLAISRAVIGNRQTLLLDELSFGLSPILTDEIFAAVERLKQIGLGILIVEQYAERLLAIADTVYVMNKGVIVFAGEPCELTADGLMDLYVSDDRVDNEASEPGARNGETST